MVAPDSVKLPLLAQTAYARVLDLILTTRSGTHLRATPWFPSRSVAAASPSELLFPKDDRTIAADAHGSRVTVVLAAAGRPDKRGGRRTAAHCGDATAPGWVQAVTPGGSRRF
jgi:hypothetical protein